MGRTDENTFFLSFTGDVIGHGTFNFEGVTLTKWLEPVVDFKYRKRRCYSWEYSLRVDVQMKCGKQLFYSLCTFFPLRIYNHVILCSPTDSKCTVISFWCPKTHLRPVHHLSHDHPHPMSERPWMERLMVILFFFHFQISNNYFPHFICLASYFK